MSFSHRYTPDQTSTDLRKPTPSPHSTHKTFLWSLFKLSLFSLIAYLGWQQFHHHYLFTREEPYKTIFQYYLLIIGTPLKIGHLLFEYVTIPGLTHNYYLNTVLGILCILLYISILTAACALAGKLLKRAGIHNDQTLWTMLIFGPAWIGVAWFIGTFIVKWANTH